ncbi:MAG: addiction module protein [Acidobacteriota bacterium]
MSQPLRVPPGFDDLPIGEQIDYVQALWGRIAQREDQIPVPDWHREVIAEQLEEYRADPEAGRPWEEIEAELQRIDPVR